MRAPGAGGEPYRADSKDPAVQAFSVDSPGCEMLLAGGGCGRDPSHPSGLVRGLDPCSWGVAMCCSRSCAPIWSSAFIGSPKEPIDVIAVGQATPTFVGYVLGKSFAPAKCQ